MKGVAVNQNIEHNAVIKNGNLMHSSRRDNQHISLPKIQRRPLSPDHDIVMAGAGKHTGNLDKLMIVHSPRRVTAMFCDLNILFTAEIVIRIRDMPPALRQSIHILAILVGVL